MTPLHAWAQRTGLSQTQFRELLIVLGQYTPELPTGAEGEGKSEAWAQTQVRLEASRKGIKLFRNNVGVLPNENGRPVRYGLCNDSPQLNKMLKSADLIGIAPRV